MKELLAVLGVEGSNAGYGGKAFERIFYALAQRVGVHESLTWPVMTPADAKTFRNQATKLLQKWHDDSALSSLPKGWSIRRSMLDDSVKCEKILECVARMILLEAVSDVESVQAGEADIRRLEELIGTRVVEVEGLKLHVQEIKNDTKQGIVLNRELWEHFSKRPNGTKANNVKVDYAFKKVVRRMANVNHLSCTEDQVIVEKKRSQLEVTMKEWQMTFKQFLIN